MYMYMNIISKPKKDEFSINMYMYMHLSSGG